MIKQKRGSYKVAFWIVLTILILETAGIVWLINLGIEAVDKEAKCSNEVCFNIQAASFIYDTPTNTCVCYNADREIIHQEILK